MKTLTYALILFGIVSLIPAQAAGRTGRPGGGGTIIITNPPVSHN